jgi:hypothetical protein
MKKHWSIDEILIKLPIVSIKLKAPIVDSKQVRKGAERIALVEGLQGMKVGFKSFSGSFVGADIDRNGELMANGPKMNAWETFELFRLPDGKVTLRTCNGRFVGAKLHEHAQLVADRPYVRDWETFTIEQLADGKIAFLAFNNLYVSADSNRSGELVADRPKASGWEAFTLTLAA